MNNEQNSLSTSYTYPFFYALVYKYGIVIADVLMLSFYLPNLLVIFDKHIYPQLLFVFILVVLGVFNKFVYNVLKKLPFRIVATEEGLELSKYFLSKRVVTVRYDEITALEGGYFNRDKFSLSRVYSENSKNDFYYFPKLRDAKQFTALLLSRVNKELYNDIISKFTQK